MRRRGVDLSPVDATTEDGARLLQAFVWADQTERSNGYGVRSRSSRRPARVDPRRLRRRLPALLADRRDGAQQVVFQTASTMYLPEGGLVRLRTALEQSSRVEPLVFLSSGVHDEGYALELERYPGGKVERLAVFDFHGAWLEWGR